MKVAFPYANHESIEIPCTASAVRYNFLNNVADKLQNKYIVGIAAHHVNTTTITPGNANVVNDTVFRKTYVTLSWADQERVSSWSLPTLQFAQTASANAYVNGFTPLNFLQINFYKSYVSVANAAGLVAGEAFLLSFWYINTVPAAYKPRLEFNK